MVILLYTVPDPHVCPLFILLLLLLVPPPAYILLPPGSDERGTPRPFPCVTYTAFGFFVVVRLTTKRVEATEL